MTTIKSPSLRGLIAATHTPFHADGSLNLEVIELQAAHLTKNGIGTAFIGGTTGESASLTVEERKAIARRWCEVTRGSALKVIVHVGANCLADARVLAAQAESLGAASISALAPSYFKPRSLELLIACCADIAGAAPATPFYYYDIPVLTGVHFSMVDFLAQAAAKIPTLAGIKFTNPDLMSFNECLRADTGRWDVPWGIDEHLLGALALGAKGAVGSSYNFAAPVYHRLIAAFTRGDLAAAREEQWRSVRLIKLLGSFGYMGAAKAIMEMLGIDVGSARLPDGSLSADQQASLRTGLEKLGFFDWICA
jgi:N-acetylneuraminate lyase